MGDYLLQGQQPVTLRVDIKKFDTRLLYRRLLMTGSAACHASGWIVRSY